MPYSVEYIEKEGGLITVWEGSVSGDELARSLYDRFSSIEKLKKLRYFITDHSNVSDFNVTSADIEKIAQLFKKTAKIANRPYGVAIGPKDIIYGLTRMWQVYASDDITGWHTHVVRTRKEAYDWLRSRLDKNLTFSNLEKTNLQTQNKR